MKAFAALFTALDATTKTTEKIAALTHYFANVSADDAAWTLYFLSGRKLPQPLTSRKFREWAIELIQIPEWLFAECYDAVGDLSETVALLLPHVMQSTTQSLTFWIEKLIPLKKATDAEQKSIMLEAWQSMEATEQFLWNKLITGQFRVGVSQQLVIRALAQLSELPESIIAHRLMGNWQPAADFFTALLHPDISSVQTSQPYPFYLASPLTDAVDELGDINDWLVEWKWDGIRAQMIKRDQNVYLWSRGEELITERFPELAELAQQLPEGTVLDGEILPWQAEAVASFNVLQRRLGRKNLSKRLLQEIPVIFMAFDLVEWQTADFRLQSTLARRQQLTQVIATLSLAPTIQLSPQIMVKDWQALSVLRAESRQRQVEGVMLKQLNGHYLTGRKRGAWWKWKIDPLTVDAVLINAQRGHGRRASLYTDYTFAIWVNGELVPFAKAYSGLTDKEIIQIDAFIRRHTLQKFGPVRTVKPELVFELAFEGIQRSNRHKSGIAVRFPRILRQRLDKTIEQADSIETLEALLKKV